MKVSLNWLNDYVDLSTIDDNVLQHRITNQSQEVEALYPLSGATKVVIGYTKHCEAHPDASKLSVCQTDVGNDTLQIVCGAPNVKTGQKVVVSLPGSTLPGGMEIKKTTLRGVESNGMIASLKELGIDDKYLDEEGIAVLDNDAPVGNDALEYLGLDDRVLELDLTPNRSEMLSMFGVAYDVRALFDVEMTLPTPKLKTMDRSNAIRIESDTQKCPSYYARVIDGISVAPSPQWMQSRLIAAGIRPINNVVDITNYVMLETNQPLHAFDYDSIETDRVLVREAQEGETFTTLDEQERTLKAGDILITNGEKPIALGGVMGGLDSEVTAKTTSIMLESATFDPVQIRRTSRRLDLRSESSMRFERGLDPAMTRYALDRAAELFSKYAGGSVRSTVQYFDTYAHGPTMIELSLATINGVLGSTLEIKTVETILKRLEFPYDLEGETFTVHAPSRRQDIEGYQDIIEEIGRIHDYNNLPATLPSTVNVGGLSEYQTFKRKLSRTLSALGLNETITYVLRSEAKVRALTDKGEKTVALSNPLSKAHAVLALTPLNGLVETAQYNANRKREAIHLYELGKRYEQRGEQEILGLLMSGPHHDRRWMSTPQTDFFTLKGVIGAIMERFGIEGVSYTPFALDNYHPHQTARIICGGHELGHIGKLHPEYAQAHDLSEVFVAELNIETLFALRDDAHAYERVHKYPSVRRDIALVVEESTPAGVIINAIKEHSTSVLKDARVFDVYAGDNIEEGKKSLAIRMRFEDKSGTLKAQTVDEIVNNLLEVLKKDYGAFLR